MKWYASIVSSLVLALALAGAAGATCVGGAPNGVWQYPGEECDDGLGVGGLCSCSDNCELPCQHPTNVCRYQFNCFVRTKADGTDVKECRYRDRPNGTALDDDGVTPLCPADGNPCTTDYCHNGNCYNKQSLNGTSCADGNACTGPDTCSGGVCSGPGVVCNDNQSCTTDACNGQGGCTFTPKPGGTVCDDGISCTGLSACNGVDAACPLGPAVVCSSDNDPCTTDLATCNGTIETNTGDGCHQQVGTNQPCAADGGGNDGFPCTDDKCDSGGTCNHRTMDPGEVCQGDLNDCTKETCNGTANGCFSAGCYTSPSICPECLPNIVYCQTTTNGACNCLNM